MSKHFKQRKKLLITTFAICAIVVITTMSLRDNEDGNYAPFANEPNWETAPPVATKVMVQQLDKALPTGENVLLQITYAPGAINGTTVTMYTSDNDKIILNDDGLNGDVRAKDNVFSVQIKEDIAAFTAAMEDFDRTLEANSGNLLVFKGRTGSTVQRRTPFFNKTDFSNFRAVEISPEIFSLPPQTTSGSMTAVFTGFNGPLYNGSVVANPLLNPISATVRGSGPPPPPPPF